MSEAKVFFIRYLPPKESGNGKIISAVSCGPDTTLEDIQADYPDVFVDKGFYSLLMATGDTLTITE